MTQSKMSILLEEWGDELLHNLSEKTSSCIALLRENGDLIFANKAINELSDGFSQQKLMNPSFEKLFEFDNKQTLIFTGFLTIGENHRYNTSIIAEIYRKNNMFLIIGGVNASQLMEQNQTMHHLNKEISSLQRQLLKEKKELIATMSKLNEANKKLEISNAAKDKFFGIIAHDLKNPFNTILGFSNLLATKTDKYDKDKIQTFAKTINLSAKNTYKLLENLLEWSKSQTGRTDYKPQVIVLNTIVTETKDLLLETAKNKNIAIKDKIPENFLLFADPNMLSSILRNLISNALKYTNKGGRIEISAKNENEQSIISVNDNGTGMSESVKSKLFKIHEKVSKQGTDNEKGTGLGLLLCKEFVEKHEGKIWAESEEGKGSKFSFTLPSPEKS